MIQNQIVIQKKSERMDFIKNLNIIEQACEQFVQSHPSFYNFSNEIIPEVSKNQYLRVEEATVTTVIKVKDRTLRNDIRLHIINNTSNQDTCIVYLHGLSSYCIEGKFLIPFLGESYSLCLFDSRAHGKNQGSYVTYGLLEAEQLLQILKRLVEKGYKSIVLWGRSMGAVTCLRTLQLYSEDLIVQAVKYVIADSPFSSFKRIATELVCKMVRLPEFIAGIVADAFANKIQELHGLNLKDLNLCDISSRVPVVFLYSNNDEIMGLQHMEDITSTFNGPKQAINIEVSHNEQRPKWVLLKLIALIKQYTKQEAIQKGRQDSKKRGLSITRISSNKFLSMVTPTTIKKTNLKYSSVNANPILEKSQLINQHKIDSKQNAIPFKKSRVGSLCKFSSAELSSRVAKSTTNKENRSNYIRKLTADAYF